MMDQETRFIVRSVREDDLDDLYALAQQSSLVSLPPDRPMIEQLIRSSLESFSGHRPMETAVFVFALEDCRTNRVIGESLVHASCASREHPYYYFSVADKKKQDRQLNLEINHQVLRLSSETCGVSMCGGLILHRDYHARPEKLGSVIALTRFIYMGMFKDQFNPMVLSEVVAPLSEDGTNPFWDAVGKPFTGIDFKRFLEMNRQGDMDFAGRLFPREDIYLCLLPEAVRPSEHRLRQGVGRLAKHIIQKTGFRYMSRIHFHGGPILGVNLDDITLIRNGGFYPAAVPDPSQRQMPAQTAYVGAFKHNQFTGGHFPVIIRDSRAYLSPSIFKAMHLENKDPVFLCLSSVHNHREKTS